jgi:hypothetical protein
MTRKTVFSNAEKELMTEHIPSYQSQSAPDFFTTFIPVFLRQFPVEPTVVEIFECGGSEKDAFTGNFLAYFSTK